MLLKRLDKYDDVLGYNQPVVVPREGLGDLSLSISHKDKFSNSFKFDEKMLRWE